MPFRNLHPTAAALVKTCDEQLNTKRADQISTEELIEKAGVSKGSMYHHFEDLKDLIEITFIYRFSKWVDLTIDKISGLLTTVKTAEELKNSLFIVTKLTQQDAQSVIRVERAWIYSEAHKNKRFEGRLRKEAERLTSALEDLVADVINKGLFKPDLNARVVDISGHTDSTGQVVSYDNQTLSDARSKATLDYLKRFSPKIKSVTSAYAFSKILAEETTQEGLYANRRAEVSVS